MTEQRLEWQSALMVVERLNHQCAVGMTWPPPNRVNLKKPNEWVAQGDPFFY